jgi:CDP-diacylglycerol--glycerol-3-phosphate 3-phosphatidyltransferase
MAISEDVIMKRLSVIVYFIAVITDWYDGWYARKYKSITKIGIFLDTLADKILTSMAFVFFYIIDVFPLWMLIAIVIRDIAITILRSYDEYNGETLRTSFNAKVKTFIQMTYIFLILLIELILSFDVGDSVRNSLKGFLHSGFNYFLMLVLTIITLYTGFEYLYDKFKHVKSIENNKEKENN